MTKPMTPEVLAALEKDKLTLRELLSQWGGHSGWCPAHEEKECDCGFAADCEDWIVEGAGTHYVYAGSWSRTASQGEPAPFETKCECYAMAATYNHPTGKDMETPAYTPILSVIRCDWCKGLEESVAVAEFRESELRRDVQRLKAEITRLREQANMITAQLQAAKAVVEHSELFSELSPHHRALVKAYRATRKGGE